MDISQLVQGITPVLVPLIPYLLKLGEKAAEETGEKTGGATWGWAKDLWAKLQPKIEVRPATLEAVNEVATSPDDADAQAALRLQLKKLLTQDEALANEVSQLWNEGKRAGIVVAASGDRSVAIGRDAKETTIVTGDSNTIKP